MRALVPLFVALVALAGCQGGDDSASPATTAAESPPQRAADTGRGACPLTLPNGRHPSGQSDTGSSYGNGRLWTEFWPHNVVIATDDQVAKDGTIGMKWPWWRGARGRLHVSGKRLDGPAAPLRADIPDGYGPTGFQASGLYFAKEGCWRVTARVGDATLTFVTVVLKASTYSLTMR
ncbi:MAG TPA: hypothetical protein VH306_02400 [Gaiellaceae bacterium]|jgi:hypothetical protein